MFYRPCTTTEIGIRLVCVLCFIYSCFCIHILHGHFTWNDCLTAIEANLGLYSLSLRTSYRKISWSLEVARFGVIMIVSLWNVTGISLLLRWWSNFGAIGKVLTQISRIVVRRPSANMAKHRMNPQKLTMYNNTKEKHNKQCAYLMEYNFYITFETVKSHPVWCIKLMHSNAPLRITKPQ